MEEQNIPVDINTSKLLEWLINRRHCQKNWQAQITIVREKIKNAIQDMPANDEIIQLLSGTYINYSHCLKIVEILKKTEADTKNLFGYYGSQRMKDWQEIIRLYEKDNLYLAEIAQTIIRNVTYEVPSLKKQIQKLEQSLIDLEKKGIDYKKSETIAQSEFVSQCKELGISGSKIKSELIEKVTDLPKIYNAIAKKTQSLDKVIAFYDAFVQLTLGRSHDGGCVPTIRYIIDKGNTTTYEWTYGEVPLSIVDSPLGNYLNHSDEMDDERTESNDPDGIDFGNFDLNESIDFGETPNQNVDVSIDWNDISVEGIVNVETDDSVPLEESGIVVEASGQKGGLAEGILALTILDNPSTRSDFIDQLFELEAFLKLRLYELKADDRKNLLNFTQLQDVSPILQDNSLESTQIMLDNVQIVISEILDSKLQHLHNIKHSKRYVDVLASSLKQKLNTIDKSKALQKAVEEKKEEVQKQISDLRPVIKLVVERTKKLQKEVERDISQKYNNRVVNLSGAINTL